MKHHSKGGHGHSGRKGCEKSIHNTAKLDKSGHIPGSDTRNHASFGSKGASTHGVNNSGKLHK